MNLNPLIFGSLVKILFIFSLIIYIGHTGFTYANPANKSLYGIKIEQKNKHDKSIEPSLNGINAPIVLNGPIMTSIVVHKDTRIIDGNWSLKLTKNPVFELNMNVYTPYDSKKPTFYHMSNYIEHYNITDPLSNSILDTIGTVSISTQGNYNSESIYPIAINIFKNGILQVTFIEDPLKSHFDGRPIFGKLISK